VGKKSKWGIARGAFVKDVMHDAHTEHGHIFHLLFYKHVLFNNDCRKAGDAEMVRVFQRS